MSFVQNYTDFRDLLGADEWDEEVVVRRAGRGLQHVPEWVQLAIVSGVVVLGFICVAVSGIVKHVAREREMATALYHSAGDARMRTSSTPAVYNETGSFCPPPSEGGVGGGLRSGGTARAGRRMSVTFTGGGTTSEGLQAFTFGD
eukprot:Rhum_TRINITY_DN23994_c0_g1::Rhum_TRINITY_DN23994_c0_g1_i1::g.179083::m.179083